MIFSRIEIFIPILIAAGTLFSSSFDMKQEITDAELRECITNCQDTFEADRDELVQEMRDKIAYCISFGPAGDPQWEHSCTGEWEAIYLPRIEAINQAYWDCDCDCMIQFNNGVGCQN